MPFSRIHCSCASRFAARASDSFWATAYVGSFRRFSGASFGFANSEIIVVIPRGGVDAAIVARPAWAASGPRRAAATAGPADARMALCKTARAGCTAEPAAHYTGLATMLSGLAGGEPIQGEKQ